MSEIKIINLSENTLEVLPQSLLSLATLEQLDLKRNRLCNFFSKNSKCNLFNLYFLDLSANKLGEVPEILV